MLHPTLKMWELSSAQGTHAALKRGPGTRLLAVRTPVCCQRGPCPWLPQLSSPPVCPVTPLQVFSVSSPLALASQCCLVFLIGLVIAMPSAGQMPYLSVLPVWSKSLLPAVNYSVRSWLGTRDLTCVRSPALSR